MLDGRSGDRQLVALRVLGPVAVVDGAGNEVALPPQKREILAVLAAATGRTVATSALVTAVWGDDSPAVRHRLKSQITQLRPLLPHGLSVEFRNGGYRLTGPMELLDSTRFESMVARSRDLPPASAVDVLAAALTLWHGDVPFDNVANDMVSTAAWNLLRLREVAVLALADAGLATGRAGGALVHLARLFDELPTREDVVVRYAALLAASGRAMDALAVVQRHREVLADKGAVISPAVDETESRILRHQFPIAPAPAPERPQPGTAVSPGWLPRRRWVDRLDAAARDGAVLLVGEAGVGKSSLVHLLERRLASVGTPVVWAATPAAPGRPMEAIVCIVDALRATVPDALVAAAAEPSLAAALARLGVPTPAPGPGPVATATTRDAFVADLATVVASALHAARAVLVVEDVHWLDASAADVLAAVVAEGVRAVMTSRPLPPDALATGDTAVMELEGFDEHEVDELLRQLLPVRGSDDLARELHRLTGGNPLFLGLALDVLARGELGAELPASLHRAVEERTAGLSRTTLDALQVAAVLGHSFPLAVLWRVRPRARHALASAVDERLVRIDADGEHGHFLHGLVADTLAATVAPGARIALHDELCRALVAAAGPAVAVATHAVGSAGLDPVRAADACVAASRAQAAVYEWDECLAWAERGLVVVTDHGMTGRRVEAELRALAGTARRRHSRAGSVDDLDRAAEVAHSCGAHDLFVDIVTELCLHGQTTLAGTVHERALAHLDAALDLELPPVAGARLRAAAATLFVTSDATERGRALYLDARRLALASGDADMVRTVLLNAHLGLAHPDDLTLRWDAARHLDACGDDEARWEAAFLLLGLAQVSADRALVDRAVDRLRELTPAVRARERASGLLQVETVHAFLRGELDEAARLADRALAAALEKYSASWAMSVYAALIFPIREAQGRAAELTGAVAAMVAENPTFISWHAIAAYVAAAAGDLDAVERELAFVAERDVVLVPDTTWTAIATLLARPVHAVHDRAIATRLYDLLSPYAGQLTWNGLCTHGPVDMGLSLLACTLGDDERAHAHWHVAEELARRMEAPHLVWAPPVGLREPGRTGRR